MKPDDNLLDISDPSAPIYRILPKHRFMELLATRKNVLVRPRKWADPFENFFLRAVIEEADGTKVSLENIAEGWYGQCWTMNEDTDAMWRIYSPDPANDSIKIKTTVQKLFGSFYQTSDKFAPLKFLMGKVRYQTEQQITDLMDTATFTDIAIGGQSTGFARLLCVKREAFSHENEVRLLYQDVESSHTSDDLAFFDFDLNVLCDEAVLDPRMKPTDAATLQAEIEAAGCTLPISQSPLYRAPVFKLRMG